MRFLKVCYAYIKGILYAYHIAKDFELRMKMFMFMITTH